MRRVALTMALVMGLALVAVHAAPVAQQKTKTVQTSGKAKTGRSEWKDGHQARFEGLLKDLHLTDKQKAEAKRIFSQTRERVKAVRDETKLTKEQKLARAKEIRQAALAEFRKVLTPVQQKKLDAAFKKMKDARREEIGRKFVEIGKALNLTPEQKTKIKQIMASHRDELKALKENKKLTPEQKKAELKEIRAAIQQEIRSILTPEQQKKFDQIISKAGKRTVEKAERHSKQRQAQPAKQQKQLK